MTRSRTEMELFIENKFKEVMENMASKANIEDLKLLILEQNVIISKQKEDITNLKNDLSNTQDKVAILSHTVENLKKMCDSQEQYSRRSCLRIKGIKKDKDETSAMCVQKVIDVCNELNVEIKEQMIDRAHRVGRKRDIMIVKFTSFKHRTSVYRNRKVTDKYKIHLDLTKKRLGLLDQAKSMITKSSAVQFVFGDINCNTVARLVDGSFKFFDNIDDFVKLL